MGLIDFSSTLLSVACSLIIGGALYLYMRRKISALESLHVEQARLLKSFIAQQQSMIIAGGGGVVTPAGNVLSSQNEPVPTSIEENPQSRIVVSDNSESESDNESYDEDDASSSGVTDSESSYESDELEDSNIEELSSPTRSPQVSPEPPTEHRTIQLDLGDGFPAAEPEVTNLSKMRVDSLRTMALENGVVNSLDEAKKIKKQTLIEMIEAHQTQSEPVLSEQTDSSTDKGNITAEE